MLEFKGFCREQFCYHGFTNLRRNPSRCAAERAWKERRCRELAKRSPSVCYCTTLASWETWSEMSYILFFTQRVQLPSLETEIWQSESLSLLSICGKTLLGLHPYGCAPHPIIFSTVSVDEVLFFPLLVVTCYGNTLREEGHFSQVLYFLASCSCIIQKSRISGVNVGAIWTWQSNPQMPFIPPFGYLLLKRLMNY